MFSQRLHQARLAAGLSQRALAAKAQVSAMMISKYERGHSMPSSEVLLSLASALGLRTEYFFRTSWVELERIEHRNRHTWNLTQSAETKLLSAVREQLERWLALDDIIGVKWTSGFSLPKLSPKRIVDLDEIETTADRLREHWNLGLNPIPDLIDTLEARGVKVLAVRFDDSRFEGMSARAGEDHVIVVGQHWPGDRQRFTIAHELGHIVLDDVLAPSLDKETAANRFAGAFLVPLAKVWEVLGTRRRTLEFPELHLLKHEFGLSMAGWNYRALEAKVITKTTHSTLKKVFSMYGWNVNEPGDPYPKETPRLFEQSVYRALGEELIGESKAAELLCVSVGELASRRRMETASAANSH